MGPTALVSWVNTDVCHGGARVLGLAKVPVSNPVGLSEGQCYNLGGGDIFRKNNQASNLIEKAGLMLP